MHDSPIGLHDVGRQYQKRKEETAALLGLRIVALLGLSLPRIIVVGRKFRPGKHLFGKMSQHRTGQSPQRAESKEADCAA